MMKTHYLDDDSRSKFYENCSLSFSILLLLSIAREEEREEGERRSAAPVPIVIDNAYDNLIINDAIDITEAVRFGLTYLLIPDR